MKMKVADIIKKSSVENMAQIIGAVIAMIADGISTEEAMKIEYQETLKFLKSEMEVDYKQTNADRIRFMSDEELAKFLETIENLGYRDESIASNKDMLEWLQSEVELSETEEN